MTLVPDDINAVEISALLARKRAGDHRHGRHDGLDARKRAPQRVNIAT
jgi:hypothetical protein